MIIKIYLLIVFVVIIVFFSSCPMTTEDLKLINKSSIKIKVLINLSYPDTSLRHSLIDKYIEPNSTKYIGESYSLKKESGMSIEKKVNRA